MEDLRPINPHVSEKVRIQITLLRAIWFLYVLGLGRPVVTLKIQFGSQRLGIEPWTFGLLVRKQQNKLFGITPVDFGKSNILAVYLLVSPMLWTTILFTFECISNKSKPSIWEICVYQFLKQMYFCCGPDALKTPCGVKIDIVWLRF